MLKLPVKSPIVNGNIDLSEYAKKSDVDAIGASLDNKADKKEVEKLSSQLDSLNNEVNTLKKLIQSGGSSSGTGSTVEKSMWYGRLKLSEVGGSLIQYSSITADMIKNSSNLIKKSPSTLGKTSLGLESSTETGDYIVVVVPTEYTVKKDNGFGDKTIFNEDIAGSNGINITIDGNLYKVFGEILLAPAEIFIYID